MRTSYVDNRLKCRRFGFCSGKPVIGAESNDAASLYTISSLDDDLVVEEHFDSIESEHGILRKKRDSYNAIKHREQAKY